MSDFAARPSTEVKAVLLNSMDSMFERLVGRLEQLSEDEYLWEPTVGMWSVRHHEGGPPQVEGCGDREISPAPVTTIAWRMWHISIDCLDSYTRRFQGDESSVSPEWTLHSDEARRVLATKWDQYRSELVQRDMWSVLGESWGPWSDHSVADMAIHASNELVHHGAEIALLRDLFRADRTIT